MIKPQIARKFQTPVHVSAISSGTDLTNQWAAMGNENGKTVDIDAVVLLTHSNVRSVGFHDKEGEFIEDNLSPDEAAGLSPKKIKYMICLGCNIGHPDSDGRNMAESFMVNQQIDKLVASSGYVYYKKTEQVKIRQGTRMAVFKSILTVRSSAYHTGRDEYLDNSQGFKAYYYPNSEHVPGTLQTEVIAPLEEKVTVLDLINRAAKAGE